MAQLPSELWNEIIDYTISVFGELEERTYDPFCCSPTHELELALVASQSSRYNLIHVSRAFYALSIPYLYRSILVDSAILWERLVECLAINQRRVCDQLDTPLNSSFVRRIHLLTAWPFTRRLQYFEQIDLPNLVICTSARANLTRYKSGACHNPCLHINAPQLRALAGCFENASDCLHTAVHFPSLVSCFSNGLPEFPLTQTPRPYDGSSIRLEATMVGTDWPFNQHLHLDLTRLRAIKMIVNTSDISYLYNIGHQIRFLDIATSHLDHRHLAGPIELSKLPSLVTLIIDIAMLGYKWRLLDGQTHQCLKRVGFMVPAKQQPHVVYRYHFKEFDRHRFPALQQIRILEMPVCCRLLAQNPGRVGAWSYELGARGVRLEAADGTLLAHLPTTTVCPP
jgi:hypothetical protein